MCPKPTDKTQAQKSEQSNRTRPDGELSLVPSPTQSSQNPRGHMLVPDKVRTAAIELLERVRVTLDIPSRAEVVELADRIAAIGQKIDQLEIHRQEDAKRVIELQTKQEQVEKSVRKPRTKKPATTTTKAAPKKKPANKPAKTTKAKAPAKARKAPAKATTDRDS